MKKFLGKLFTLALYAFVIGAIVKAGYDMYSDTEKIKDDAKKSAELTDRLENFVPTEVAPYTEDWNGEEYFYKSIGGEIYREQSWDIEGIPSYATMSLGDAEEQDITEYFSYDEIVHTYIVKEELLNTLENGDYRVLVHYDEEKNDEFWFTVRDELINNVPAQRAYRPEPNNSRIYNKLSNVQDISLYYCNIGDNHIVDVLKYNEGTILGLLDPNDYTIAPTGNKVILKKEYLQSLSPNTKIEYGVRLADGTIVYEPWTNFWTIEDEWAGCIFVDAKDYSLSEGGDYVLNIKRNDTQKLYSFAIDSAAADEEVRYIDAFNLDWHGHEYFTKGGNTIVIPEEVMKTLPVDKELYLFLYYYFDYDNNVWCDERVLIKVIP